MFLWWVFGLLKYIPPADMWTPNFCILAGEPTGTTAPAGIIAASDGGSLIDTNARAVVALAAAFLCASLHYFLLAYLCSKRESRGTSGMSSEFFLPGNASSNLASNSFWKVMN